MGAVAATLASLVVNAPYVGSDLYIVFLDVCTPLFLYSFFIHSLLASPVLRKCVCVCGSIIGCGCSLFAFHRLPFLLSLVHITLAVATRTEASAFHLLSTSSHPCVPAVFLLICMVLTLHFTRLALPLITAKAENIFLSFPRLACGLVELRR